MILDPSKSLLAAAFFFSAFALGLRKTISGRCCVQLGRRNDVRCWGACTNRTAVETPPLPNPPSSVPPQRFNVVKAPQIVCGNSPQDRGVFWDKAD